MKKLNIKIRIVYYLDSAFKKYYSDDYITVKLSFHHHSKNYYTIDSVCFDDFLNGLSLTKGFKSLEYITQTNTINDNIYTSYPTQINMEIGKEFYRRKNILDILNI